jgi:hypothetical protein
MTTQTTRRALLTVGATAALAMPLSATATPASGLSEDERFLAWERKADTLWEACNRRGIGDDETERLSDEHDVYHRLILDTPSVGLTPARVKASTLERWVRDDLQGHEVPLAEIVAALRAAGAR